MTSHFQSLLPTTKRIESVLLHNTHQRASQPVNPSSIRVPPPQCVMYHALPSSTILCLLLLLLVGANDAEDHERRLRFVHAMTTCDETTDGADVRVFRCLGGHREEEASRSSDEGHRQQRMTLDPFLVLDAYRNTQWAQFEGGFPAHAHRGFFELRYITEGALAHNDSCGNYGVTSNGGVQAMFTGRGIVHEEQTLRKPVDGLVSSPCRMRENEAQCVVEGEPKPTSHDAFRGFQVWVNVPEAMRDLPPAYATFERRAFPRYPLPDGGGVATVFAGRWPGSPDSMQGGPISGVLSWNSGLLFAEVEWNGGEYRWLTIDAPKQQHFLLYVLEGSILVGDDEEEAVMGESFAFLGPGDIVRVRCAEEGGSPFSAPCKYLVLTAPRVREPVIVSRGFVAGTEAAMRRALRDLREGNISHC